MAITYRNYLEDRSTRRLVSWQTRKITEWVAATIPTEKNSATSPVEMAYSTVFADEEEREAYEWAQEQERLHPAEPKTVENAPGSYERFMNFARGRA